MVDKDSDKSLNHNEPQFSVRKTAACVGMWQKPPQYCN